MWIGFIFWYRGTAQGGIAAVGQLQLLQPFFGTALAGWLLHETVQPMMIAVMAGVVVCVFGAKRFPARRRCRRRPDHLSEPFHRLLHGGRRNRPIQHQTRLTVAGRIHRRHRPQRQSGFVGALGDPHVIEIFPQPQHHVHALIAGLHDRQLSGDMRVDRLDQHPAFLGVDAAHFADMPVEIPFGDKGGQHVLIRAGRMAIHQDHGAAKGVDQRRRHDGVTQPQRREQHLAEGAEIERPFGRQPLQRRERVTGVAHLAVVVVFHDPGLPLFGRASRALLFAMLIGMPSGY